MITLEEGNHTVKTDHEDKIRRIRTVCNPVNINYRYRAPMRSRKSADPAVDQSFFLRKAWYKPMEALKRRNYQYLDEIPASVELLPMEGFDAPDIRFYNKDGLDLYTNVYRRNIMDMAYHKITDDGMTHTSSAMTAMEAKGLPVTTADGVRWWITATSAVSICPCGPPMGIPLTV